MTDPTPSRPPLRVPPPVAGQAYSLGEGQGTSAAAGLQELLARAGTHDRSARAALLRADQLRRWQSGRPLPVEAYLEQVPGLREDEELVLDLVWGEFLLRQYRGEQPRLEEYLERFPAQEEQLRIHFSLDQLLADDAAPAGPAEAQDSAATGCPAGLATAGPVTPPSPGLDPSSGGEASRSPAGSRSLLPQTACTGPDLRDRGSAVGREAVSPRVQVADYEVLGELGRGGMGVVYKAFHLQLKREVALKMILAGSHATPHQLERFKREAESVARLQHPNIVQIYEVGEHQGLPFFALEFVEGGSLDRCIAGTPQPARAAGVLVEKLARAMHAAHQRRIVHRDLKPANILLGRKVDGPASGGSTEASGKALSLNGVEPKITDFGLAKQLDDIGMHTASDAVLGTLSYMAPEQAQGRTRDIGPVTDVYALGAILYELLTGRPPFKGATTLDTLAQVCGKEPVAPHQLQPGCPRDLETICLKCLQKEPRKRYANALNLVEDLRRFLAGEPIQARPVGSLERALKWMRRRPAQAALVGAVALAVLGAAAGGVFYGLYKGQQEAVLRQQLEHRQGIDQLWDEGQEAEAAGQLAVARGQQAEAVQRLEWAAERLDRALATLDADPEAADDGLRRRIAERRASVRRLLEGQAARQQLQARVRQFFEARDEVLFHEFTPTMRDRESGREQIRRLAPAALALWGLTASTSPPDAARALEGYRQQFESAGQAGQVAAGCYEVLLVWAEAEAEPAPGEDAGRRAARARQALVLLDLAEALGRAHGLPTPQAFHARRARYLDQLGEHRAAAEERERAAGARPTTALDFFLSGLEGWLHGQFEQSAQACEEALQRQPDHFWAQYLLALCRLKNRQWGEARVGLSACLGRRPGLLWPRLFRATALAELGQVQAAEADFARVLEQARDPLSRYVVLTNRGAFWIRQKRWGKALADLREAIKLRPESYQAYVNLAQVHRGQRDWDAAVQVLDQALERQPGDAGLYQMRARIHLERKDWEAARKDFEQVIACEPPGSMSGRLASAWVELAYLRQRAGDHAGALAACARVLAVRPGYAPAYRQRAEVLLAQGRHAEAGQALDQYLGAGGKPTAEVYRARGLIHTRQREYLQAVDAYTRALQLQPDAPTLCYRGWVHLKLEEVRSGLADFESALKREPGRAEALCGRGHARLALGRVMDAVADAEEALRRGPRTEQLLFNAACLYARASGQAEKTATAGPAAGEPAYRYREQALKLLRAAVEQVPAERRQAYWRRRVEGEPALAGLRGSRGMLQLERSVAR